MKETAKTATPMAQKALYLSHFTPSMMRPETLQSMLVQRQPLLDACYDDVVHSVNSKSKHHHLFVGPRGIGKTHLVSLLHHRLMQAPEMKKHGLMAWMREEEWGVTSFFELVLRILRTLDQNDPALELAKRTTLLYELPLKQAEAQATSLLIEVLGAKTLVVLVENLDDLFEQLGDAGQRQLRGFIQNHQQLVLVATTPSLFAGVSLQKSPFYGFFDIQSLKEFSLEDVTSLLRKIAIERKDESLADFIQTPEGRARIRAVHHLAEGNPRIYVIFAQFLSREALDELVQAVMHTLDELTPYYQARMKELSGQQRKIVEYLVSYRGAAPVKQIAKACFITQQTCSGQLKQLRDKRYVRSIEQGRESYYELTEPLMRLCMEVKQQRGEPIGLFVDILRIWYTEAELQGWLSTASTDGQLNRRYVLRALELMRTSKAIDPIFKAQLTELVACSQTKDAEKARQLLEEMASTKPGNEITRQFRAVLLSSVMKFIPGAARELTPEINSIIGYLRKYINQRHTDLTKNDALSIYTSIITSTANLIQIDKKGGSTLIPDLHELLGKFPAQAAIALIRSPSTAGHDAAHELIKNFFSFVDSTSTKEPNLKLLSTFSRICEAIVKWQETGEEKHLLALPREERNLAMTLQIKQAAKSHE